MELQVYNIGNIVDPKVQTAFLKVSDVKIEFLEPTFKDNTIAKFLETKGLCIHHITYVIDGFTEALQQCKGAGTRLIDKSPRKDAEDLQIVFLHPKSSGSVLTELCKS